MPAYPLLVMLLWLSAILMMSLFLVSHTLGKYTDLNLILKKNSKRPQGLSSCIPTGFGLDAIFAIVIACVIYRKVSYLN